MGYVDNMVNSSEKMKDNRTMDSTENLSSFYLNYRDLVFSINKRGEFIWVNIWETSLFTMKTRRKVLFRKVSRLFGKETGVYNLDVVVKNGNVFSLEIDTKPYIKNKIIAGEIGVVKNGKKIIHNIKNVKVLSESEKNTVKKRCSKKITIYT